MNSDLKKRIKEKSHLWFKLKSVSRNNAGDRTELQGQYRAVSKKLKTDTRSEISGFEINFGFEYRSKDAILVYQMLTSYE